MSVTELVCPRGMDPSVFACLPPEIQQEIVVSSRNEDDVENINGNKSISTSVDSPKMSTAAKSSIVTREASTTSTGDEFDQKLPSLPSPLSSANDSGGHQPHQNQQAENDPLLGSFLDRKRHIKPSNVSRPGAVWVEGCGIDVAEEPDDQNRPPLLSLPSKSNLDPEELAFLPDDMRKEIIEEERRKFGKGQIEVEDNVFAEIIGINQGEQEGGIEEVGESSVNIDTTRNDDGSHCKEQHFTYKGDHDLRGSRHGKGEIKWENGDSYEGSFSNDDRDGIGMLHLANGCTYNGGWKNDLFHGSGTWRDVTNGYTYTGQYKDGQCNGRGMCTLENGDKYNGEWKDGLRDGYGIYTYSKGGVYEGMHRHGKRHGPGQYTHKNLETDVSQYVEGQRTGVGIKWSKNRKKAWLLQNGKKGNKISTSKAKDITFGILGHEVR